MNDACRNLVAVIVASTESVSCATESLRAFAREVGTRGIVVVVDTSGNSEIRKLAKQDSYIHVLKAQAGQLAPELWRKGLDHSDSALVAFSTIQMVPEPAWLDALLGRLESSGAAAVGGPIAPGDELSVVDRAVALLRYSTYFPGPESPPALEPPGDNAIYRRDRLDLVPRSWSTGFWESDVNQALRARGELLAFDPSAVVVFQGGTSLGTMIARRWAHGLQYGESRRDRLSMGRRWCRILAAPLVPPLLAFRVLRALRERSIGVGPWLASLPALLMLATSWAAGEAVGLASWRRSERMPLSFDSAHQKLLSDVQIA
jgi:hypothetical protein